jgi:hypothetical protein
MGVWIMATINEQLDELKTQIIALLPSQWSTVYGYRTAPEIYKRYACLFHYGTEDGSAAAGGSARIVDFMLVLFAQHDKTEAAMESAERDLNEAEDLVLATVTELRNNGKWLKAVIPWPTVRPRQPRSLPETRLAEIPVRLIS